MSRNRFGLLLANLHFANNGTIEPSSRLGKVLPLINILIDNYQKIFSPGEDIVVDETMVPWRRPLIFRQYILTKSHKYGIKLFKLCSTECYSWSAKVYSGREITGSKQVSIAENICIELADKFARGARSRCGLSERRTTPWETPMNLMFPYSRAVADQRLGQSSMADSERRTSEKLVGPYLPKPLSPHLLVGLPVTLHRPWPE